ncbi:MAG: hypothetical protein ACRDN0_09195 [Trebonia sp.]
MSVWSSGPSAPAARRAEILDLAACCVTLGLLLLVAVDFSAALRLLLAVAFTFFVPGRAIVSNWPRVAHWSAVGMSVGFSLGALALLATFALWTGFWHPLTLFVAEATISLAGISIAIVRRRQMVSMDDD